MASARVIPIKQLATGSAAAAEDAHARLERAGFKRKTVIGEPRLSELVENYKAMGYEVEVVPFKTEETGSEAGCNTCFDASGEATQIYGTVYVRPHNRPPADDELF